MDPIFSHLKCLMANRLAKEASAIVCTMKISIKLSLLLYKATSMCQSVGMKLGTFVTVNKRLICETTVG